MIVEQGKLRTRRSLIRWDPLIAYVENQAEHHRKETFQDEFRGLLEKYGIEYDERYVWD